MAQFVSRLLVEKAMARSSTSSLNMKIVQLWHDSMTFPGEKSIA
jgi:hypothetical protein